MSLFLASTYSFQYAVDVTDPEAKNYKDQIPYTPRHSGTVSVNLGKSMGKCLLYTDCGW